MLRMTYKEATDDGGEHGDDKLNDFLPLFHGRFTLSLMFEGGIWMCCLWQVRILILEFRGVALRASKILDVRSTSYFFLSTRRRRHLLTLNS